MSAADLKAAAARTLAESQGDGIDRTPTPQDLSTSSTGEQQAANMLNTIANGAPDQPAVGAIKAEVVVDKIKKARTFVHQTAGANTILPDGTKLTFGGRPHLASINMVGGRGLYVTDVPEEIEWLAQLVKMPSSQVTEMVEDPLTHTEKILPKRADPTIMQSVRDAAENSERVFNPTVSAVVENMGAHIASGMAADSNHTQ